ncbi:MAG: hypothetical protein RLY43_613 [Bacteroidota bacterium]|jgi:hypothetical protein
MKWLVLVFVGIFSGCATNSDLNSLSEKVASIDYKVDSNFASIQDRVDELQSMDDMQNAKLESTKKEIELINTNFDSLGAILDKLFLKVMKK